MEKKSKKGIIIAVASAVAAVILIIAVIIGVCVYNGMFLKPADKVLLATKKTLTETTPLIQAADISDYLESGKYTVGVDGYNEDGSSVEATYVVTEKKQQLAGEAKISSLPNFEVCFTLEGGAISAYTPLLDDYEFVYHYDEVPTGAITGVVTNSQISTFNDALTQLESLGSYKSADSAEIGEVLLKDIRALNFEKADSKKFEVDGKDVKCKGYKVVIDSDTASAIFDDISDEVLKNADNIYVKQSLENAYAQIKDMDKIELTFYIKSNKLACVVIDVPDENEAYEIRFKGGDTRWQNLDIVDKDGDVVAQLIGATDGDCESYKLMDGSNEAFALSYNSKDGNLDIAVDGEAYAFTFLNDGKTASLETFGFEGITGKITLTKNAEFKKNNADKVIDIGNADTSELQGLVTEILMNPEAYDIIKQLF